jgi:hypothetical protein
MPERGERGERGDKGEKGDTGDAGKDGRNGKDGRDGRDGKDGKDGLNGKDGNDAFVSEDAIKEALEPFITEIKREVSRIKQTKGGGGGGDSMPHQSILSSTSIDARTKIVLVNTTSGNVTVTLPSPSQAARREFHIKKTDASANSVIVSTSSLIDGDTTAIFSAQYESIRIYSDGVTYHII